MGKPFLERYHNKPPNGATEVVKGLFILSDFPGCVNVEREKSASKFRRAENGMEERAEESTDGGSMRTERKIKLKIQQNI